MRINLKKTPDFSKTYSVEFPSLAGGLNLRDLGYLVDSDESPYMKNLMWRNGLLQCRYGTKRMVQADAPTNPSDGVAPVAFPRTAYAAYSGLFHGAMFFHIGNAIWYTVPANFGNANLETGDIRVMTQLTCVEGNNTTVPVPTNRGTFFRYQDWLFYKNDGGFFRIEYSSSPGLDVPFAVRDVVHIAEEVDNAPIIVINASPVNGSGTMYQPENRLSSLKTVWYTAQEGISQYHLPATFIDGVMKVTVNGVTLTAGSEYSVNTTTGVVTFLNTAPDPGTPVVNNTVKITYAKVNTDAMNSVLRCTYATVAGGDTNLCIILGGCPAQPNAVFWNSNDELAMQYYYFPMTCYNLLGDTQDPVMGFGKQYNDVLVFKKETVGKLAYNIESIDGRNSISFSHVPVNDRIGCDLPWTIQVVQNNVVFCNKSKGVHVVLSSSSALENNIQCISEKINHNESATSGDIPGLLDALNGGSATTLYDYHEPVAYDDGERYYLSFDGRTYVWDYEVSTYADPSWFFWTITSPVAYIQDGSDLYGLMPGAFVWKYVHHLKDENVSPSSIRFSDHRYSAIEKIYKFPTLHFGTYAALKNVEEIIMTFRSDVASTVGIQYETDYETRTDLTPATITVQSGLGRNFVEVFKRKPKCIHVKQFGLTLSNNTISEELALVSAAVYYRFTGKER